VNERYGRSVREGARGKSIVTEMGAGKSTLFQVEVVVDDGRLGMITTDGPSQHIVSAPPRPHPRPQPQHNSPLSSPSGIDLNNLRLLRLLSLTTRVTIFLMSPNEYWCH
jgi:hypothetical protein